MKSFVARLFGSAGLLGALAACNLAPQYTRPAAAIPQGWPVGDAYLRASEAGLPAVSWRDIFRDPGLQPLIERAIANNQDLGLALANVAVSRGRLRTQQAQELPRIDGSAGVTLRESGAGRSSAGGASSSGTTSYNLGVGVNAFEIDLFGRVRNLSEASLQEYLGTEAAARAVRLTLIAEVASTYLTLATNRSLLAIARETETTAARSTELTRARLKGGIAPRTDLRLAESVLLQARSDVANLTTIVAQDRNALELLVGSPVGNAELPASIEQVDGLLAELPAGLDSRILLRRPDVVQAEYQLRSANAQIGVARAAFFPQISLTTMAGLASTALSSLFSAGALSWTFGPSVSLPIFDAGAIRGNLEATTALREAAVARYQKTVQTAFREVADALARRGTIDAQFAAQTQLVAAARDSTMLADARYREGIDSFLGSLEAQRTLYAARRSLAATRLVRADNLVELFKALGGDAS